MVQWVNEHVATFLVVFNFRIKPHWLSYANLPCASLLKCFLAKVCHELPYLKRHRLSFELSAMSALKNPRDVKKLCPQFYYILTRLYSFGLAGGGFAVCSALAQ